MADTDTAPGSLRLLIVDRSYLLLRTVAYVACICFVTWMAERTAIAFAGRATDVHVNWVASFFGDVRVTASITLAGIASAWAVMERLARQKVIRRYAPYLEAEERMVDPKRTSSNLTREGRSPPEDRQIT